MFCITLLLFSFKHVFFPVDGISLFKPAKSEFHRLDHTFERKLLRHVTRKEPLESFMEAPVELDNGQSDPRSGLPEIISQKTNFGHLETNDTIKPHDIESTQKLEAKQLLKAQDKIAKARNEFDRVTHVASEREDNSRKIERALQKDLGDAELEYDRETTRQIANTVNGLS